MINVMTLWDYGLFGFEFYSIVRRKESKLMKNQVMDLAPTPIENLRSPTQFSVMHEF